MSLGQTRFLGVNNQRELPLLRRRGGGGLWGCSSRLPSCLEGRGHGLREPLSAAGQGRREERRILARRVSWWRWQWCCIFHEHCTNVPIWAFCRGFGVGSQLARLIMSWDFLLAGKTLNFCRLSPSQDWFWNDLLKGGKGNSLVFLIFREGWFFVILLGCCPCFFPPKNVCQGHPELLSNWTLNK